MERQPPGYRYVSHMNDAGWDIVVPPRIIFGH